VPGPDEVEIGQLAEWQQPEAQFLDLIMIDQAGGQEADREHQREALRSQPQPFVDLFGLARQFQPCLDAALGGGDDVDSQHVFERPAGFQRIGKLAHRLIETLTHAHDFIADDADEALAYLRFHVRVVHQVADGHPDVGQAAPAAVGQRLQHLITAGFLLQAAGNVLHGEHVAAHFALLGIVAVDSTGTS
jgi:hypothetical protein